MIDAHPQVGCYLGVAAAAEVVGEQHAGGIGTALEHLQVQIRRPRHPRFRAVVLAVRVRSSRRMKISLLS
ncbi:MAG: hypothetical protein U5L11_05210 [Arhodomonas sp.]|nr:hypothetical protein [Arhodomonas sp.]